MGSTCSCLRRREHRHGPSIGDTQRTTDYTQATILVTGSDFSTTLNPWHSTRLKKKKYKFEGPDPVVEAASSLATERLKTASETVLLLEALKRCPALAGLMKETHLNLLDSMKAYDLSAFDVLYEEMSEATTFFVVTKGRLEEVAKGERIRELGPGDAVGDAALLYDLPRNETVKSLENSTLWGLERVFFKQAVAQYNAMIHFENLNFLKSIKMLNSLTADQIEDLVEALATRIFPSGSLIVEEGATDSILYIIKDGTVSCTAKGLEIRKMSRGDYFGEQALLYDTPRTASVSAITEVSVLSITREKLQERLGDTLQNVMYKNSLRIALGEHAVLKYLSPHQREILVDLARILRLHPQCSETADGRLVIVLKGTCKSHMGAISRLMIVEEGTVTATDECELAVLSKPEAEAALRGSFVQLAEENKALAFLRKVPLCRSFSTEKLKALLSVLKVEVFQKDDVILERNASGEAVYIVKSGQVQVVKDGAVLRTLEKFGIFGERALVEKSARTASVVATEVTECYALYRDDFERLADEGVIEHLVARMTLQNDTVKLQNLEVLKELGKGSYGTVFLVRDKSSRSLYALKTVSRKAVRANRLASDLQLERQLLLELDHTFIMKLVKTFKDSDRVYFLTEYVAGQELFDVLRARIRLDEAVCRFYIACLLLILEHLHERDIVYRDLKPENVLIDQTGYPKLIDFGLSKRVIGKTFTHVGTYHYTAPEVFRGTGYNVAVDYWSLGVVCYEAVTGQLPFANETEDQHLIQTAVLRGKLAFPKLMERRSNMRDFIELLLSRDPSYRLSEARKFRTHKWFYGLDWEELIMRKREAPLRPDLPEDNAMDLQPQSLEEVLASGEAQASSRSQSREPTDWDQDF